MLESILEISQTVVIAILIFTVWRLADAVLILQKKQLADDEKNQKSGDLTMSKSGCNNFVLDKHSTSQTLCRRCLKEKSEH
jgi:hypothetical protein